METHWLARDTSDDAVVYIVWSSQRGAAERNVADATRLISDGRVRHYWDPMQKVGRIFAPIIGTADPAWDVWMLFSPTARWREDRPPPPAWWEDQLGGMPAARRLDPDRFAARAAALEQRVARHPANH